MSQLKMGAMLTFITVGAAAIAAPAPLGSWKGHFKVNMPQNVTPQQKSSIQQAERMTLLITFKPDHSFSSSIVGAPGKVPPQTGKWAQSGLTVTLSIPNRPGGQKFMLSPDGKTLALHLPKGDIIFNR